MPSWTSTSLFFAKEPVTLSRLVFRRERASSRTLLDKFNNIMEDFKNQFDFHEDGKGLISKQIDLLKEAGQLIGESFFTAQIDQSKKQLELLENEKAQLVGQMTLDQLKFSSVTLESSNNPRRLESSESRSLNCPWMRSKISQCSCNSSLSNSSMAFLQSRIFPSTSERALTMESHSSVPFCTLPELIAEVICPTNCAFSFSSNSNCFFETAR